MMPNEQQATAKFYTNDSLALAIIQSIDAAIGAPSGWVLEPSVGGGAFVRAARMVWPNCKVFGVDIDPSAPGLALCDEAAVCDFANWRSPHQFDVAVGNPPFSVYEERIIGKRNPKAKMVKREVMEEHTRRCIELLRRGGLCKLLLQAGFLHASSRGDLLDQLDLEQKICPRASFKEDGGTDNTNYTAFSWRNSAAEPRRRVERLTWDKKAKSTTAAIAAE